MIGLWQSRFSLVGRGLEVVSYHHFLYIMYPRVANEFSRRIISIQPSHFPCHSIAASASDSRKTDDPLPNRWLADLKKRIGKCIIFGLRPAQVDEAGNILRALARDWRELLAGSEGFLVGRGRAGLERHKVVWGEMVCIYHARCMAEVDLILTLHDYRILW